MTMQPDDTEPLLRPKGGSLGVGTLFRGLRRHPFLTLFFLVLAAGAGAAIWQFLPLPKNTAYVVFQITARPDPLFTPVGDARADFAFYRQAQAALVKSRKVLNDALNRSEMAEVVIPKSDQVGWLDSKLSVDFRLSQEFMRLSMEGDDPDQMKIIVATVADVYWQEVVNKDTQKRNQRYKQLEEMDKQYEELLRRNHTRLTEWAENIGSTDPKYVQEQLGMAERELLQLQSEMRRLQVEATVAEKNVTATGKTAVPDDVVKAAAKSEPAFQKLMARQTALLAAIADIKEKIVPGARPEGLVLKEEQLAQVNREMDALLEKVRPDVAARLKDSMTEQGRVALAGFKNRLVVLKDLEQVIEKDVANLSEKLKKANKGQVELDGLKTDMARLQTLANSIRQQKDSISPEMKSPPRVSIYEEATVVPGIEGNRRLKYSLLTGGAILLLGLGFIGFLEARNRRIQTTQDVSDGLGLKLIGTVPALRHGAKRAYVSGASRNAIWQSMLTESVDATRTMLVHSLESSEKGRSVLVTSAMPGEGKTMLSCHLASSLARAGFRTLLIDGDMRQPMVHRILEAPPTPGLCELLRGEVPPSSAIQTSVIPELSFLPAGVWDLRVPQTLSGERWRTLQAQLQSGFDYLVIDSPPLLLVADGLLMARQVGGVVFSVLRNVSRLDTLCQARDQLSALGVQVLGVVVSGYDGHAYPSAYRRAPGGAIVLPQDASNSGTPEANVSAGKID